MPDHDTQKLAKLPKWAQDYIALLEIRLRESQKDLQSHLDDRKPSSVAIQRILDQERPFAYLPEGSTVAFFLDNDHEKEDRLRKVVYVSRAYPHRCEKTGPYHLEVSTAGSGCPSVQPQAANVVRIRVSGEY